MPKRMLYWQLVRMANEFSMVASGDKSLQNYKKAKRKLQMQLKLHQTKIN